MSIIGIIMFLGRKNTRLERKILIILDFENGFLPTYLPLCNSPVTFLSRLQTLKCLKVSHWTMIRIKKLASEWHEVCKCRYVKVKQFPRLQYGLDKKSFSP